MEQELEFILRDIIDDLKSLKANNIDLQNSSVNIIDRISAFEKLLKEQKQHPITTINTKSVEEAFNNKFQHLENFIAAKTLNKRIEHKHHLHEGLLIALILTLLCLFLSFGWYNSYNISKQLKANDIKYRALKVVGNQPLLKLLHHTDSLYSINSDSFELKVKAAEKELKPQ